MEFNQKIILVTGGTKGIGLGVAEQFVKLGGTVIATYSREIPDHFIQQLSATWGIDSSHLQSHLFFKKCSVSVESEVRDLFLWIEDRFQKLDVLVNNAGLRKDQLGAMMTEEEWDVVLDTNLKGTFLNSKYAVNLMLKNRFGRIIHISSIGGILGLNGQGNYAASKAGQMAYAKVLSKEVAKKGITVNSILPGFIETDLIKDLPTDLKKDYLKDVPMKRFGNVQDVAHAVLFFASEKASYITGAELTVAGGL